jgi:kojibiose phosphorylase
VSSVLDRSAESADWSVAEDSFDPARIRAAETVYTIGNGRFATRGSFEEGFAGGQPATLAHGVFAPHPLAATELANLPDWTELDVDIGGERFSLTRGKILAYRRVLDFRTGLLRREIRWRSPKGATADLLFERFISLADDRVAGVRVTITALDFGGSIEVRAGLNARPDTQGLAHLAWEAQQVRERTASLVAGVRGTTTRVALAMRLRAPGTASDSARWDVPEHPTLVARWKARPGQSGSFEKIVVLTTSRDDEDPLPAAQGHLAGLAGLDFDALYAASADAWARDWAISDVVIEGDHEAQLATRFSIYQLLIAAPRADEQVSIGAKTLSGFGYRGHVFWDCETFMLPFFTHVHPQIARNLLSYRYHRLPGARRKAADGGYDGAQFPWESAAAGDEVTPPWWPDATRPGELIRIWTGDIEIHVTAVIAHAVIDYWRATADDAFMLERGGELVVDSARFWASRVEWNAELGQYELSDVIGPDEYHDHVDNNAFTNYLVAWHLRAAADLIEWLTATDPARAAAIAGPPNTRAETATRFRSIADGIYLPYDAHTGLIEQFSGFFERRPVDLAAYADRTRSMQDILSIEGVNETQVIKQPDVLLLAHLLPEVFSDRNLAANHAYYTARTDHEFGSSLGPSIQALVSARIGQPDDAYPHFIRAARADLRDIRGNTGDGIHGASAGGLWQAVVFGFAGLRFEGDEVTTDPQLPSHWRRLAFRVVRNGRVVEIDLRAEPATDERDEPTRGLIFDLDGVLTDTAEAHYLAWQRLADEEGLPFDRAANEALRGIGRRESLRHLLGARAVTQARAERLMARKNAYYRALIAEMSPSDLLPGALELLDAARARGLRLAIGSASKNARDVIDRLGIADRFDAICDGHAVEAAKPAPDLFLAAAAALGLPAEDVVVFEDAADGVAAAHAAGMMAIGIGPVERVGAAEIVLPTGFAETDLEEILTTLAERRESAA